MAVDVFNCPAQHLPSPHAPRALPCVSALVGVTRASSAGSLIEKSFREMQMKSSMRSMFSPDPLLSSKPNPHLGLGIHQVSPLAQAAVRHLDKLHKSAPSPYQRLLTADEHKKMRAQVVSHLKDMACGLREAHEAAIAAKTEDPTDPSAAAAKEPAVPDLATQLLKALLNPGSPRERPSTAISVTDMQMPRPGSRSRRLSTHLSASWSGANPAWPGADLVASTSHTQTPSRLGTPSHTSPTGGLLSHREHSMPLSPTKLSDVWRNQSAGRDRGSVSAGGAFSGGGSGGSASPRRCVVPPLSLGEMASASGRPYWDGTGLLSGTRSAIGTKAANVTGSLVDFAPTRGMVYSIFAELDGEDCGKLTYSAFEGAAFIVGMRADHARRFFDALDCTKRGYITVNEWGAKEKAPQVLNFTRLYVQQTRGPSGRHKDAHEISSLSMAVEMAMHRLSLKNNGRSISSQRLADAFSFIDTDGSGELDRAEIADAFSALGIMVNPAVVDKAMTSFDTDGSGTVDYNEFLRTLFPTLSKSYNVYG